MLARSTLVRTERRICVCIRWRSACTQTAPCGSILQGIQSLPIAGGRIVCVTPVLDTAGFGFNNSTFIFDCPSATFLGGITFAGNNVVLKFQGVAFSGSVIKVSGGGTLILEDCVLEDVAGTALDIEPTAPFDLVMKNSRVSNNTAVGVLIKPSSGGGSVTATFDGVTITNNAGGLKTDTTNGSVTVDIFNSTINKNANNGLIALGGAGGQNVITVKNDIIATNGQAGIEASGFNAGARQQRGARQQYGRRALSCQ